MSDREYWITVSDAGDQDRRLHIDPECSHLKAESTVRPTTRADHPNNPICSHCSGEFETYDGGCAGLHDRLKDLDPEDVGRKSAQGSDYEPVLEWGR